ncbi:MAG: hypothetical protein L0Z62_30805 [Gemmataceae bacterium]|nr:hypothetical protein [Gemmataceae bacterium]
MVLNRIPRTPSDTSVGNPGGKGQNRARAAAAPRAATSPGADPPSVVYLPRAKRPTPEPVEIGVCQVTFDPVRGLPDVVSAMLRAFEGAHLGRALRRRVKEELHVFLNGLVPGLKQALAILMGSTAGGAVIGAVGGAAVPGGVVPGAVAGAVAGFEVGVLVLNGLGLACVVEYVIDHIAEYGVHFYNGIQIACSFCEGQLVMAAADTRRKVWAAADEFGEGIAVLLVLVLAALLMYLAGKGMKALGKELRKSKLGGRLFRWLTDNFQKLTDWLERKKAGGDVPPARQLESGPLPKQLESGPLRKQPPPVDVELRKGADGKWEMNPVEPRRLWPPERKLLPPGPSPREIGKAIGESVLGQSGRMKSISKQITERKMVQQNAADAADAAMGPLGLNTGPQTRLPDGSLVVTSIRPGPSQPVLVVRPDGSVFSAKASIAVKKPYPLEFEVTEVKAD